MGEKKELDKFNSISQKVGGAEKGDGGGRDSSALIWKLPPLYSHLL